MKNINDGQSVDSRVTIEILSEQQSEVIPESGS